MSPVRSRRSLWQAFAYAFAGLRYAVQTQRTFRIQLVIAAGIGLLLLWLRPPTLESAVTVLSVLLVLVVELLNTCVEVVVDQLTARNHHDLAKVAKDLAADAVVVAAAGAALVGILVLGPMVGAAVGVEATFAARWTRVAAVLAALVGAVVLTRLALAPARRRSLASSDRPR